MDVADMHNAMIQQFLKQSNPTWRKVVEALRAGMYSNLADEIEQEFRGTNITYLW